MKAKKLLLTALAAACLLAGTAALAACGEKEPAPAPAPEDHAHDYGEWVITAPTLSAAGSAKKVCDSCEAGTAGHEVTVTLPVLTDSGYTKSGDTATCEGKGEATYTVTVDGNEFTFTGETAPKGHAYHEHAAVAETCTTDGNAKYYTCDNCTKVFDAEKTECKENDWVIAKHHFFEEHAAQDATCAAEGNKLYYSCEKCEKYFDEKKEECEEGAWVLGKSSHSYGDWVITAPTADGTGVAKKTCSVCAAGTEGHELTLTLPALTDSGYSKTEDTATCSSAGEITYTITVEGTELSFTVTTAKKAHEEFEWRDIPAEKGEGGVYAYVCTVCGTVKEDDDAVYSYAYDSKGEVSSSHPNYNAHTNDGNSYELYNQSILIENKDGDSKRFAEIRVPILQLGEYKIEFISLPVEGGSGTPQATLTFCPAYKNGIQANQDTAFSYVQFITTGVAASYQSTTLIHNTTVSKLTNETLSYAPYDNTVGGLQLDWVVEELIDPRPAYSPNHNPVAVTSITLNVSKESRLGDYFSIIPNFGDKTEETFEGTYRFLVKVTTPENPRDFTQEDWSVLVGASERTMGSIGRRGKTGMWEVLQVLPLITDEGYTVERTKEATREEDAIDHYSIDIEQGHFEFDVSVKFDSALVLGETNTVKIFYDDFAGDPSSTNQIKDFFTVKATAGKTYILNLSNTELLGNVKIYIRNGRTSASYTYDLVYDSATASGGTVRIDATSNMLDARKQLTICFVCEHTGELYLNLVETDDPDYGKLGVGRNVDLNLQERNESIDIEMASGFTAGWYKVYLNITTGQGGWATLDVMINHDASKKISLYAGRSGLVDSVEDTNIVIIEDFALYIYLNEGDVLTYTNTGVNPFRDAPLVMEAHEHGEGQREWKVTAPTEDEGGYAEAVCVGNGDGQLAGNKVPDMVFLPALNSGKYTTESVEGGTKYSITIGGETIEFVIASA